MCIYFFHFPTAAPRMCQGPTSQLEMQDFCIGAVQLCFWLHIERKNENNSCICCCYVLQYYYCCYYCYCYCYYHHYDYHHSY